MLRELHLSGGGRVFNGMDQKAIVRPATVSKKEMVITLNHFHELFENIENLKFKIIGCDFFRTPEEARNTHPPEWRIKCAGKNTWLCTAQGDEWSFIANSALQAKNGIIFDMASRISHQIRACEWRVRQLSECYADQVRSRCDEPHENGSRFKNGYTSLCYLALQAFLVDACILRDYLAEFYWQAVQKKHDSKIKNVTTLSGLLTYWKSNTPTDAAGREIAASAQKGQWIFELGAYRDLVVHTAPLAKAGKSLFAVDRQLQLPHGEALPGVKLPLPNNPAELKSDRVTGKYFLDTELNFARFTNAIEDIDNCQDALEYSHTCMQLLGAMSGSISDASPIRPEMPVITPIVGSLKINGTHVS